ncbi:MAG: hypothetical protein CHACPFDD_03627 [Phycisphaerae bacterium]|nr:hypothetical protein [Phycisphaerae bacterium]
MNPRPFSLPLSREQFAAATRAGLGRALMHVAQHGAEGVDDLIVDCCLRDPTFDPQCECARGPWIGEIAVAAGLGDIVAEKVAAALRRGPDDACAGPGYLCGVALSLARRGHDVARAALYEGLKPDDDQLAFFAADEIVELDGIAGLLHVAEQIGAWLSANPGSQLHCSPLDSFVGRFTRNEAELALAAAVESRTPVRAYLDHLKEAEARRASPGDQRAARAAELRGMSVDDVVRGIESAALRRVPIGWVRQAPVDALREFAERMHCEQDPSRLGCYLRAFAHRAVPDLDARLLRLADHADSAVRSAAHRALALYRDRQVRALALRRARAGRHREHELQLFLNNRIPGDWARLRTWLRWPTDENDIHWALMDLLDVFQSDPTDEAVEPLLIVSERTPCSACRSHAVERLVKLHRAPDWLIEECRFDVDERTRTAVGTAAF